MLEAFHEHMDWRFLDPQAAVKKPLRRPLPQGLTAGPFQQRDVR